MLMLFVFSGSMAAYRAKIAEFQDLLSVDTIDIKHLRKCSFNGCPFEKSVRARAWKVLLNYLPLKTDEWPAQLKKQRNQYTQFLDELIIQPGIQEYEHPRTDVTLEDHPLNPAPDSTWNQYFKDNEMLLQIDKDCRRLLPDLAFFQSATMYPCEELVTSDNAAQCETLRKRVEHSVLKSQNVAKNRLGITYTDKRRARAKSEDYVTLPEGEEAHWEVAERILFVFCKLNPCPGYVQGMNEIIGPIYYTMASDAADREHAEADTFWCFTNLMGEIRDNFIKTLDDSFCGIGMLMCRLVENLKKHDTTLWLRLKQQELQPQFYAFRWLTLLLSQEFPLPDVLRLWDSLFADANRFDFLISVGCAMLLLIRTELMNGDFAHNMKMLQNYPSTDIQIILSKALELYHR